MSFMNNLLILVAVVLVLWFFFPVQIVSGAHVVVKQIQICDDWIASKLPVYGNTSVTTCMGDSTCQKTFNSTEYKCINLVCSKEVLK